jgi:putative transposase
VLARYAVHYNPKATASIAGATSPRPDATVPESIRGRIRRRPVLGGLINDYEAAA